MKYLIVQDWESTSGNHAGMVHMCKLLVEKYPDEYEMFVKPKPRNWNFKNGLLGKVQNRIIRLRKRWYETKTFPKEYMELCTPLLTKLKDCDKVFLLEYLLPWTPQYQLACILKNNFPKVKLFALSHLTCKYFDSMTSRDPNLIEKWSRPIDKMLTLGSSLSAYFVKAGIDKEKISTGFHYVDSAYYHKHSELNVNHPLTVIAMGALQRDYSMLANIVKQCNDVHWIICRGRKNVDNLFPESPNIELKGYLSEDELRQQMDRADVSLNVMEDTVGSNVITTSMAMGLSMIVTDVGSIRDYCDNSNAIFCKIGSEDYINAIRKCLSDDNMVLSMKKNSLLKSKRLEIKNIHKWFEGL